LENRSCPLGEESIGSTVTGSIDECERYGKNGFSSRDQALTFSLQRVIQVKPKERPKKAESKRTREDDIPPEVKPELEEDITTLRALQNHLRCAAHSKPGMVVYCWIGPAGGHREMSHEELTLWAQYIVSNITHTIN
jgi:hypothetical protein